MKCNSVLVSSGLFHHQIHGIQKPLASPGPSLLGMGDPIFGPYTCHQPSVRIHGLCIYIYTTHKKCKLVIHIPYE